MFYIDNLLKNINYNQNIIFLTQDPIGNARRSLTTMLASSSQVTTSNLLSGTKPLGTEWLKNDALLEFHGLPFGTPARRLGMS
jgi:hypothetical protein